MAELKVKHKENSMRVIQIEKLTLNIGAGTDQKLLEKGIQLLKHLTGITPVKTFTNKRIPTWGVRPGLPIGCKLTIRGKKASELIQQLVSAKDNKLSPGAFDDQGNVALGIHEYIDIEGVKYNPDIGIIGLQACITLERPGFRIKKRKIAKHKVPKSHKISKDDAINFMKETFKVKIE